MIAELLTPGGAALGMAPLVCELNATQLAALAESIRAQSRCDLVKSGPGIYLVWPHPQKPGHTLTCWVFGWPVGWVISCARKMAPK
jgi:hypothetical protein